MDSARPTTDRFLALDGLRGVAILLVILQHGGLLPIGWMGVDLFFALSGFLITGILLDAKAVATGAGEYFVPFYGRRALRILPIAMLLLAVCFVGLPWALRRPELEPPAHVQAWYWLYLTNWRGGESGGVLLYLRHFWSLAVEEQFYLVWPAIVLALSPRSLRRVCLAMVVAALVMRCAIVASPWRFAMPFTEWTITRWDGLAAGAYIACRARAGGLEPLGRWFRRVAGAAAIVVASLLVVQRGPGDEGAAMASIGLGALGVGMGAIVGWVVVAEPRWLRWRPLQWVGTVSYGLYVYHHPIAIALAPRIPSALVRTAVLVALSLPIAAASWYLFERPILTLKRYVPMPRAARPLRVQPVPESSAA